MSAKLDKLIEKLEARQRSGDDGNATWVLGMNSLLETWLSTKQPTATVDQEEAVADALLRLVDADYEPWGVGKAKADKAFDSSRMDDGKPFELITGEHPHSRSNDSHYARFSDGTIEGFDGHRILTKVELRTFNYLKCSGLSGNEVRKGGQFRIWLNDVLVWAEFMREAGRGLRKAAGRIEELVDLPVKPWVRAEIVGRKIFYKDVPATIRYYDCMEDESSGNRLTIEAMGEPFKRPAWLEKGEEHDLTSTTCDILSPYIWWWRD